MSMTTGVVSGCCTVTVCPGIRLIFGKATPAITAIDKAVIVHCQEHARMPRCTATAIARHGFIINGDDFVRHEGTFSEVKELYTNRVGCYKNL